MSKRTDAHRPVALVTEDYEYVASLDLNPPAPMVVGPNANGQYITVETESRESRAARIAWLQKLAASPEHRVTGQCDHCGAPHVRYIAIMRYLPTGNLITVGETCIDNRFGRATGDFQAMRKQAELDRKQQRIRKLVAAFVEQNPDLCWMASLEESWKQVGLTADGGQQRGVRPNYFILNVSHKLRKYGELSDRQVAAVRAAIVRDAEYAVERAVKIAAAPVATPVVTGRIEISGEVLNARYTDGQFPTYKMLVRDDRGFKVWGTVPNCLGSVESGQRVKLTATVEASTDDNTFGFFSRPKV